MQHFILKLLIFSYAEYNFSIVDCECGGQTIQRTDMNAGLPICTWSND